MKLKRYNKETLPSRMGASVPQIRISAKGHIVLNRALSEKLNLSNDSKLELLQNEEAPKEWFLAITSNESALPLRSNDSQDGYKLQSTALARSVINAIAPEEAVISMLIGKESLEEAGEQLWPIITSSYKQFLKNK